MRPAKPTPDLSIRQQRHDDCFFQAEDCIRDHCVTGVQTCALPISDVRGEDLILASPRDHAAVDILDRATGHRRERIARERWKAERGRWKGVRNGLARDDPPRSEERSVGNECRSWCPYDWPHRQKVT